ncbi:hypothetical protein H5T51_05890, partial [Candidatus Bathyarchaeota archaeon]|nr:hypothetical protein [Candidatus Bathyarchaeota archaeon]
MGSQKALNYGIAAFLPAVLYWFGLDELHALSLVATFLFALLPISAAYVSWLISRSRSALSITGLLASFFPLLSYPALAGDYALLAAVAFTSLSFSFSLHFFSKPRYMRLALLFVTCALALLSDCSVFIILLCYLFLMTLMSWVERDPKKLWGFLSLLMFVAGLGLSLTPFNVAGYASIVRNSLVESGLYNVQALIFVLAVAGVTGVLSLYYTSRKTMFCVLAIIAPLALMGFTLGLHYFLFAVPIFLALCSHLVVYIPGVFRFVKQAEDFIVEIKLERLIAGLMFGLLVVATFFYYPSVVQAYSSTNMLSEEEVSSIRVAGERLRGLVKEGQLIAAPPRVAAWLGAFAGLDVVTPLTADEKWLLDSFTSTTFRLMNSYIMVDEWQPFSSRRSPFIYAYDGRVYALILHMDDGTNAMNVIESNVTWHEDLHGLRLLDYSWVDTHENISLILQLWKKGFNVTKTVTLAKNEAKLSVSYHIVPNEGVTLVDMVLPVYIEGRQRIVSSKGDAWIQLEMPHVKLRFTYKGASTPPALVYSSVQDYVVANFTAKNEVIDASVEIILLNPQSSREPVRYASFFDILGKWPVNYLMTYAAPENLFFLEDALPKPIEALEIIDSFNRVLFSHEGVNYVEAPSDAKVISESVLGQSRNVSYQTAGLIFHKRLKVTADAVLLSYDVKPIKNQTKLISMTLSLWIPWARTVFMQEHFSRGMKIVTD